MNYFQQGDVLLKKIEKLPDDAKLKKTLIVQEGETTGHAHRFSGDVMLYENDGNTYVSVEKPSPISHEEHGTITIPEGFYFVDLVREYDYDKDEVRRVVD